MKFDFHIHTYHSHCSSLKPEQAIKLAVANNLDVIALISHNLKPIKYESDEIKILPGVEVSTKQGHLLIINTTKEYKKWIDAQEAINQAEENALIIIPHPFDNTRSGMGEHLEKLNGYHAIELNARCLFNKYNNQARAFAEAHDKPLVAGSDSHFNEEVGNAFTSVNAKNIDELIKKVKQGKTRCQIKKRKLINKLVPYTKSVMPRKKVAGKD